MNKLFAVVVATVPEYYEYKKKHPEHDQDQVAWFKDQYAKGNLLCCGPFFPHDGTGVWVIQAENLDEAWEIVISNHFKYAINIVRRSLTRKKQQK